MGIKNRKLMIVLVCSGNTCRSPMAKVILEQKLKEKGLLERFEIDSAAFGAPTDDVANPNARAAIKQMYGQDLLASHKSKGITRDLTEHADFILAVTGTIKNALPKGKTWTLKEYAGSSGDVSDPIGQSRERYLACAYEISELMDSVVEKLSRSPW